MARCPARWEHPLRVVCATTLLCVIAVSCATEPSASSRVDPVGPPTIRAEVVESHADQFDDELVSRPAGSQQEFAASQYLLGHLQKAGYVVELDSVPVEDLVESNNLLAFPPGGEEPTTVVVVGYDSDEDRRPNGTALGVFVELARALYAAETDHRVEFAALAAERTADQLGSRRLARQLRDEGIQPDIVTLLPASGDRIEVAGHGAEGLLSLAKRQGVPAQAVDVAEVVEGENVFAAAGFDHLVVGVARSHEGDVLLEYLASGL